MISLNFVLLLLAAICFGVLVLREVLLSGRHGFPHGVWLSLGLLLWELPALIAVWP